MPKLKWDQVGQKTYETGVSQGVLYPQSSSGTYPKGVAWNGLTAVTESPSGAESNPLYADDIKYLDLRSAEEFGGTIEAYTYPDEWMQCDGSAEPTAGVVIGQQNRTPFGLCYKTVLGNDVQTNDYGYKLHIIWNATAAPSERAYQSINDSPEAITFSWEFATTPVPVTGYKPTAYMCINSTKVDPDKLGDLLDILYGTDGEGQATGTDAYLPTPDQVIATLT